MFKQTVIVSVMAAGSVAASLTATPVSSGATSTITPAPQLELRQNNDRYIGWVSWSGSWIQESCDLGGTFYQTDSFWRCCHTSDNGCARTDIPVGCISGSLIYPVSASGSQSNTLTTYPCTSIFTGEENKSFSICNTVFMFNNDRDSKPLTNVNCGVSSLNWSYYRQAPATAITDSTRPSSARATTGPSASLPGNPVQSAPPIESPQDDPQDQPSEKKESKAWIAGAVVGPIVGIALIGLAAFLFWRHKKKQQQAPSAAGQASYGPAPTVDAQSPPQYPQEYYGNQPMQQNAGAPGMVPFGVAKHDSWAPTSPGGVSPNTQYGAPSQQQWDGQNMAPHGQPVYGGPSPTGSPAPGNLQPAPYAGDGTYKHTADTARPFSTELPADMPQYQPFNGQVRPQ